MAKASDVSLMRSVIRGCFIVSFPVSSIVVRCCEVSYFQSGKFAVVIGFAREALYLLWIEPLEVVVVGGSTLHEADGCSRGTGGYSRAYLKLTAAAVGDDGGSGREQTGA